MNMKYYFSVLLLKRRSFAYFPTSSVSCGKSNAHVSVGMMPKIVDARNMGAIGGDGKELDVSVLQLTIERKEFG